MIEQKLKRFGLKVKGYRFRRDISSVHYRNIPVFNVRTKVRRWSNAQDNVPELPNMIYPNYHDAINSARLKWVKAKMHPWWLEEMNETAKQNFDPNYDE